VKDPCKDFHSQNDLRPQRPPADAPLSQIQAFSDSRISPANTHLEKYQLKGRFNHRVYTGAVCSLLTHASLRVHQPTGAGGDASVADPLGSAEHACRSDRLQIGMATGFVSLP
jgi:hypothetical protein